MKKDKKQKEKNKKKVFVISLAFFVSSKRNEAIQIEWRKVEKSDYRTVKLFLFLCFVLNSFEQFRYYKIYEWGYLLSLCSFLISAKRHVVMNGGVNFVS